MPSVGIIDDHPVTLYGIRSAFDSALDMDVVVAESAPNLIFEKKPNLVVLDVYLASDFPCIPLIERLKNHSKIIMCSALDSSENASQCLAAGARAFVSKSAAPEQFVDIARGLVSEDESRGTRDVSESAKLSPREGSVLAGIAQGFTHDQIARRLGISKHTVDTYIKRVRAKLHVGNKADLTRAALAIDLPAFPSKR